jgi:hypothetical protein
MFALWQSRKSTRKRLKAISKLIMGPKVYGCDFCLLILDAFEGVPSKENINTRTENSFTKNYLKKETLILQC